MSLKSKFKINEAISYVDEEYSKTKDYKYSKELNNSASDGLMFETYEF
jgi:hypothetical protein